MAGEGRSAQGSHVGARRGPEHPRGRPTRAPRLDGRNDAGEPVVGGVYVYRVGSGDYGRSRRMEVLK